MRPEWLLLASRGDHPIARAGFRVGVGRSGPRWQNAAMKLGEAGRQMLSHMPPVVRRVARRLVAFDVLLPASSLAFYALVSILPLLLLTFAAVERIAGTDALRMVQDHALDSSAEVGVLVRDLTLGASRADLFILVSALWPATAYGAGLQRALRHMAGDHEAGDVRRAPGIVGRLVWLGFVLVMPVLVLLGLPLAYLLTRLAGEGIPGTLAGVALAVGVGSVATAVVLTLVYRVFAPRALPLRSITRGAVVTAVALTLLALGAIVALGFAGTGNRYGNPAVTATVLLGLWLFLANIVVLVGYQTMIEWHGGD